MLYTKSRELGRKKTQDSEFIDSHLPRCPSHLLPHINMIHAYDYGEIRFLLGKILSNTYMKEINLDFFHVFYTTAVIF
jgi:hypothetical protein